MFRIAWSRAGSNWTALGGQRKPLSSEVLSTHLQSNGCPPWTSYFIRYRDIVDDHRGRSHYNWRVSHPSVIGKDVNYHILRTGCWPYIKFHCTQRPHQSLTLEDTLFRFIKITNLGIPCLAYGIAGLFLISHSEKVKLKSGAAVTIFFLYPEDKGSLN